MQPTKEELRLQFEDSLPTVQERKNEGYESEYHNALWEGFQLHAEVSKIEELKQHNAELLWALKQIADLDPKNGSIGTAVFMAKEAIAKATS